MRSVAIAAAMLLSSAPASHAEPRPLPAPNAPSSGEAHADAVKGAADDAARVALAHFDAWIADHPADVTAAAERCRFLDRVAYDDEGLPVRFGSEVERCGADLAQRFGESLVALAYAVEASWGDEAIEAAHRFFAGGGEGSSLELSVRKRLVEVLSFDGAHSADVITHARRAMRLDPHLDLSYPLARALREQGDEVAAVRVLLAARGAPVDPWTRAQRAKLLHELGAHAASVEEFARADAEGATGDRIAWARSLAAIGRLAEARARLREQIERGPSFAGAKKDALEAAVELEMAHGDARSATAAYRALRDEGFGADPLGRVRLAVSFAHPRAAWQPRDALGVLALLGAALALGLLPLVVLVPIHYVGLRRRLHGSDESSATTLFSLRRAWLACALLLLAEGAAIYVLAPELAQEWLREPWEPAVAPLSTARLAELTVWTTALVGFAALVAARGRLGVLLGRGGWTCARTFASAFGFLVLLRSLSAVISQLEGGAAQAPLTGQMVRALYDEDGAAALFAAVAVVIPLAEEIVFRGVVLAGVARHVPFRWANVVQAALFAAAHENVAMLPFFFAAGAAAGWLTQRSGSLRSAILLHAMNNAIACAEVIQLAARAPA